MKLVELNRTVRRDLADMLYTLICNEYQNATNVWAGVSATNATDVKELLWNQAHETSHR